MASQIEFRKQPLFRCVSILTTLASTLFFVQIAVRADILDHMPDEALGFVLVRNLESVDAKTALLMNTFGIRAPSPIRLIATVTGLGEGVDRSDDALAALLPGQRDEDSPRPFLLLPVADYEQFVEPLRGDASGAICRVVVAGEEVLVAQDGSYAMLMNIEHRAEMEQLLALDPEPVNHLKPLSEWLATTDVAVVVLSRGVDALLAAGSSGLASQRAAFAAEPDDPELIELTRDAQEGLRAAHAALQFVGAEVDSAAIGATIDADGNLVIKSRLLLGSESELLELPQLQRADPSPLAGFSAGPIVVAGEAALSEKWGDFLARANRRMTAAFPGLYDVEGIDVAGLDAVEASAREAYRGVRAVSCVLRAPQADRQIIDGGYLVLVVEDSAAYLESLKRSFELSNQFTSLPTAEIPYQWQIKSYSIAGADGYAFGVDLAVAAADPNVPQWDGIVKRFCGDDGEVWLYALPIGQDRVLVSVESVDVLPQAIDELRQNVGGLSSQDDVQRTLNLLDAKAPVRIIISPDGFVELWTKSMTAFFAQLGGVAVIRQVPEYPDAPPLGFAANLADGQLQAEAALPRKTLEALAQFIKAVN